MEAVRTIANPDEPSFPPELEREIFEIAALSRPSGIPALMLIAWRIKDCVEPLLYRVIILVEKERQICGFPVVPLDILLREIARKPLSFFAEVKNLFILYQIKPSSMDTILTACPGIINLLSYHPLASSRKALGTVYGLRRLVVDITNLFPDAPEGPPLADLIPNLTHLELLDRDVDENTSQAFFTSISHISTLTHLSFNEESLCITLRPLLQSRFTQLRCIVAVTENANLEDATKVTRPLSDDNRFVCIGQTNYWEDWLRGVVNGEDYWALAEAFITARRAGRVDRASSFLNRP
ncbi:hypothetical protein FB451DRAFT_1272570 [Mycena latifolia]|nr:hypothetical protein FB451DRAFT_1272570 [Mycena latifolia]